MGPGPVRSCAHFADAARRGIRQRGTPRGRAAAHGGARALGLQPMTTAVGASHRLPSAARLGVARRNSLRALRALRSDNRRENVGRSALRAPTPRLRCSAPPTSAAARAPAPLRAPLPGPWACPAAERRSGHVGGVRINDGALACERHDGIGKVTADGAAPGTAEGVGRQPQARLVRSREAQPHRRRAQRASSIILAAIVRAELAQRA